MTDKKITSQEDVDALKAEVARLEGLLNKAATDNVDAMRRAMYFRNDSDEIPTGNKVAITKCVGYKVIDHTDEGIPIRRPVFKEVEEDTFLYKIDLPPVGGIQILKNGISYYHNETYELTLDDLRGVKEMVYRIREHEANIHGTDENAYRPQTHATFSGKVGGRLN